MKHFGKTLTAAFATAVLGVGVTAAQAQTTKTYAYPQKGQSAETQAKDDAECRTWAQQQSGVNPNAAPPPAGVGSHARGTAGGAARGAAAGAALGAIAGDAGKGAAAGAVVGGVGGRRGSKRAAGAQQAQTADSFARAYAACMEGRGYTVK
jgi:Glycine-zipper domain